MTGLLADFQLKLETITKFLAATRNNYLQPGKILSLKIWFGKSEEIKSYKLVAPRVNSDQKARSVAKKLFWMERPNVPASGIQNLKATTLGPHKFYQHC